MNTCENCRIPLSLLYKMTCANGHQKTLCSSCRKTPCKSCQSSVSKTCSFCLKNPEYCPMPCKKHSMCRMCSSKYPTHKCQMCKESQVLQASRQPGEKCQTCSSELSAMSRCLSHSTCQRCYNLANQCPSCLAKACTNCKAACLETNLPFNCKHPYCLPCTQLISKKSQCPVCRSLPLSLKMSSLQSKIGNQLSKCFTCGTPYQKSSTGVSKCIKCEAVNCREHQNDVRVCRCYCVECLQKVRGGTCGCESKMQMQPDAGTESKKQCSQCLSIVKSLFSQNCKYCLLRD